MSFPKLDEVEAKLQAIFAEAGDDMDMSKVTTISGTDAEKADQIKQLNAEHERLAAIHKGAMNATGAGREPGDARPLDHGKTAALRDRERLSNSESVAAWAQARDDERGDELANGVTTDEAWGAWFRGYVTGDWRDYRNAIKNQMGTGTDSDGGFLVPAPLSTDVIDRLRSAAPIFTAGATTVPMTSKTLDIARVSADVDTTWHAENATITASKPTLEQVTFTAKTLPVLTKASRELAEDAPNTGAVVAQSIAGATAVELTRAALRGDGTSNDPTGVLNQTGVQTTAVAGDADWTTVANGVRDIQQENAQPNASILTPRTATALELQTDSNGQFLPPPPMVERLDRYPTTVIPTDLGAGSETEIYTADWTKLLVGMRTQLRIEPLRERFADDGQVAWLSWLRVDFQLEHPKAFHIAEGVTN